MKNILSKLGLIAVSLAVALGFAEVVTRLLPNDYEARRTALAGDPLLAIPPMIVDTTQDFPDEQKPDDVFRIVVLGDSQTVSANLASYPAVLERLLNEADLGGKRVEVHNAGAPGHSHYQYYLALDRRMKHFDPDLVVVAPYIGNDFLDLYRNDDRPSLHFDGTEYVHRDPVFYKFYNPEAEANGLVLQSSLLQTLSSGYRKTVGYPVERTWVQWKIGRRPGDGFGAAGQYLYPIIRGYFIDQHIFRQSINQVLFLRLFPEERPAIERLNQELVSRVHDVAEAEGFQLLYMPIPTKIQVQPGADEAVLKEVFDISGLTEKDLLVEEELYAGYVETLDSLDIPHIQVRGALTASADEGRLYDHTYHLTKFANEVVAKELFAAVRPLVK